MLASTYIGTTDYDQCYFVQLDRQDSVYVVGQTEGAYPVTPGVYSNPNSGQFITKLDPGLSTIDYSTVFGTGSGAPDISPTAFLVDVCEWVYVSGWGGSTNFSGSTTGLTTTFDAEQSTTDGSDLYVIVLGNECTTLEYATFMGGPVSNEHVDGGTSRFDKKAIIYQAVCAGCWGNSDFPTTSGAYSNTNNSTGCNLAAFKMEFAPPFVIADFDVLPSNEGCAPFDVTFTNTSYGGISFQWDFGDGSPIDPSYHTSHTYTLPGTYTVTLYVVDPSSCNLIDSTKQDIIVHPSPNAVAYQDTSICFGEDYTLLATGGGSYEWFPPTGLSDPFSASPTVNVTTDIEYEVVVTNAFGCKDSDSVAITVIYPPPANAGADLIVCPDSSIQLNGSGGPGSVAWEPPGTLDDPFILDPVATPSTTTDYILFITAANGCVGRDTVTVTVAEVNADAGADIELCVGEDSVLSGSGGVFI